MGKAIVDEKGYERPPNPYQQAGWLSKLTFHWVFSILRLGSKKDLGSYDLPGLNKPEQSRTLLEKLDKAWGAELQDCERRPASLLRALWAVFNRLSLRMLLFLLLNSAIKVAQTVVLGKLVGYFTDEDATFAEGLIWAGTLSGIALVENMMHHHFYFWSWKLGLSLRIGTTSLLYSKCLNLKLGALNEVTLGYIINLATNDIERFVLAGVFFLYLISSPLVALAVLYIGITEIGFSFVAGWGVLLLLIPLQMKLAKLFASARRAIAEETDRRVKLTNQAVSGVRVMKLSGWENQFMEIINQARTDECKGVFKANYLRAINEIIFFITPTVLSLITFLTYTSMGGTLEPRKVFTVIALLNLCQFELAKFMALAIQSCSEAWVSIKRMEHFLSLAEVQRPNRLYLEGSAPSSKLQSKSSRILIKNASFRWKDDNCENQGKAGQNGSHGNQDQKEEPEDTFILKNLDFEVEDGELVACVGSVGSAKSSLLMAVLNEMNLANNGKMQVTGKIAYASQEPWIMGGTIRDNILFGKAFEEEKYNKTVECCSLLTDFAAFDKGDMTIIGDRGINLSGGQRARVGLARLAYADEADIYLMDDPLSAVDPAVGKQLFEQVICNLLAKKARILVTHQLQYLQHEAVDKICVLERGEIKGKGKFTELIEKGMLSTEFLHDKNKEKETAANDQEEVKEEGNKRDRNLSVSLVRSVEPSMVISEASIKPEKEEDGYKGIVAAEEKNTGVVQWSTYREYIREMGGFSVAFLVLFLMAAAQVGAMYTTSFLAEWAEKSPEDQKEPENARIFTIIAVVSFFLAIARAFGCFTLLVLASKRMHGRMLSRILRAPVNFFDANPIGRIMNRFSKDLGFMDDQLAFTLYDFLQCFCLVAGSFLFVAFVNPWIFLVFPLLVALFIIIRNFSQKSNREVKRLDAVSRSPVYSLISESLDGLTTVRAFGQQQRFIQDFYEKMDCNSRAYFSWLAICRWLGFYLDMLVVVMIIASSFMSVIVNETYTEISGGLLGAGMTYVIILSALFQWTVRQSAEVENQMVSVERVLDYCRVPQEPPLRSRKDVEPPADWPEKGTIKAINLSARYHEKLPPVLKNLNFVIEGGHRIGIVGRTGAGKSSFVSVLFRLVDHLPGGRLEVDGHEISELGLHDLRLKMSVIPQTPFLFSGTIKENLDPFGRVNDEKAMWDALEAVQMAAPIREIPSGLNALVAESGGNWSVGQRQLLCLARALLARNKILVMDEATANIDLETDSLIQEAVRTKFKGCTVIMIAHRLHTVIDCDKILVLGDGEVVEYASPHELLQNEKMPIPTNSFLSMVNETGSQTSAELKRLAQDYYLKNH